MKNIVIYTLVICSILLGSCGEKKEKKTFDINAPSEKNTNADKMSEKVDLSSKGIGPIDELTLPDQVDSSMVDLGKKAFETKCTLCHKLETKFVGPALKGVLKRRRPEWVMNMILNPDVMLKEDPIAKALFVEFNGAPMSDQGLDKEEARAILEYIRADQ